jgi:hypothetical protein
MKIRDIAAVAASVLAAGKAQAAPMQWTKASGGNGHYYEVVTSRQLLWQDAFNAASGSSFDGLQGYLVTITSLAEVEFLKSLITPFGFNGANGNRGFHVGGSDAAIEGNWQWVAGPDFGISFFFLPRQYPWAPIQPDNFQGMGGQDWAIMAISPDGEQGQGLNMGDFFMDDVNSGSETAWYVVEYGNTRNFRPQVPEPATLSLLLMGLAGTAVLRRRKK